nr:DnaA/Hda family protein [Kordiimonas laminariae]
MRDFIVSDSNAEAFSLLDNIDEWPSHVAAVVGAKASGKSHLSQAWAHEVGAVFFGEDIVISELPAGSVIVFEDADKAGLDDDTFFHLFNWIKEIGAKLLITSELEPNRWNVGLPDLKSRLATIPVANIKEPDDELLMVLLIKLFSDRQLQVDMNVIRYILPRIERSFQAVMAFVEELDSMALADKRKITKTLAKQCLDKRGGVEM